jgi:hypothetical protein
VSRESEKGGGADLSPAAFNLILALPHVRFCLCYAAVKGALPYLLQSTTAVGHLPGVLNTMLTPSRRSRALARLFRLSTSFRVVVIALTLVSLSSWATFRAGSQSKSAAHGSDKQAGVSKEASATGAANVKKTPKGSGTVTPSSITATTPLFLADAEQIINSSGTITGGVIHFWNITLGGGHAPRQPTASPQVHRVP